MRGNDCRFLIASLAAATVLLTVSLGYTLGLEYAGDEGNHLTVVRHYSRSLEVPTWRDFQYGTLRGHPYHLYSPAPYVLHIPFAWLSDAMPRGGPATRNTIVRLAGLGIALLQFWVTYHICRLIMGDRLTGLAAAFAINLLPQLRYIHGYVNNDAASILMASVAAWFLLRLMLGQRPTDTTALAVGLTLAGLANSKYNTFLLAVPLILAFTAQVLRSAPSRRLRWRWLATGALLPLLLAGWFHLHVYTELANGHLLVGVDNEQLMRSTFEGDPEAGITSPAGGPAAMLKTWSGVWGALPRYGPLPTWYLGVALALALVGVAGCVVGWSESEAAVTRRRLLFFAAGGTALVLTWAVLSSQMHAVVPGRLLLPATVFLVALIWGTTRVLQRLGTSRRLAGSLAAAGWAAFLAAGNLALLARVWAS